MTVHVGLTIVENNKVAVIAWATSNECWNAVIYQDSGAIGEAPDLFASKRYATKGAAERWARKVLAA